MMTYTLNYADGRTSNYAWDSEAQAECAVSNLLPGCVIHDEWEHGRKLVWASEDDANGDDGNGDDGRNAVAEIIRSDSDPE